MAPENVQVVHLKLQMQPDVDFFENILKDNRAQEICKNLRISPHSKKSSSTPPWIIKSRISKQEDSPCFNNLTQDACRLDLEKSNMDKGEMGNHGVFW